MINLRYHIVSLTAVFLALGIGLTLGSTFLDRVTVDNLKDQLDTVQARVNETNARNEELGAEVDRDDRRDEELASQLPEQLFAGQLADVPVLVIATAGTDEALVDRALGALSAAGADLAGTWWITDRWQLDDADEVADLDEVLGVSTDQTDRLRRNAAIQLADVLLTAAEPPPEGELAEEPGPGEESATTLPPEPTEAEIVAALREAGFLDHQRPEGDGDGPVLPPVAGARYVLVSSLPPDDGGQLFAQALAEQLTVDRVAPLVAAQAEAEIAAPDSESLSESEARTTFVGALRSGDDVAARLSTVDDLDHAAGLAALVLALRDVGEERVGHYGVATGADRLLPAPPA